MKKLTSVLRVWELRERSRIYGEEQSVVKSAFVVGQFIAHFIFLQMKKLKKIDGEVTSLSVATQCMLIKLRFVLRRISGPHTRFLGDTQL